MCPGHAATMAPRGAFPPFAWTRRLFTSSFPSSRRASASRRSSRRCPRARASRMQLCRSCSRPSTRSWAAASWCCCPRTRMPATQPRGVVVSRRRAGGAAPESWRLAASGLEPPPHLVGERARALDVLADGGLVCASAAALAEGMPPFGARPLPVASPGRRRAGHGRTRNEAGARRLRTRRPGRGAWAVRRPGRHRRRLPLDRAGAAADRAVRRRDRAGARVLAVHAARPAPSHEATVYPAAERRRDLVVRLRPTTRTRCAGSRPATSSPPIDRAPDVVWQPDDVRAVWEEQELDPVSLVGATELDPFPRGQAFPFEAQRPAIAARGLAEAENELAGFVRSGNRVVVAFPHKGEALRQGASSQGRGQQLAAALPREPALALCRRRRPAAASSGASSALSCSRTRRCSARSLRARCAARAGPRLVRRPPRRGLRRPRGSRRRQAARLRDEVGRGRHARLSLPRVPRRRPALRAARAARQALALHRRRRKGTGPLETRRQGLAESQDSRP